MFHYYVQIIEIKKTKHKLTNYRKFNHLLLLEDLIKIICKWAKTFDKQLVFKFKEILLALRNSSESSRCEPHKIECG